MITDNGQSAWQGGPNPAGLKAAHAKHMYRIIRAEDPKYLHMSGRGWTSQAEYSWSGRRRQAAALAETNPDIVGCDLEPMLPPTREVLE